MNIPDDVLQDDAYFIKFNLQLTERLPDRPNRRNKLNYGTLGELKSTFDLRTVRNIIIKQNLPDSKEGDVSSIYEIFNRLNTGGVNLKPQEIRTSLYHSYFYEMLYRINLDPRWRKLLGLSDPDLHMKDIEVLLRAFAMMMCGAEYRPSMTRFLNLTSKRAGSLSKEKVDYLEKLFNAFLVSCSFLPEDAFFRANEERVNISFIDSVFAAQCTEAFTNSMLDLPVLSPEKLQYLKMDPEFVSAARFDTASSTNVAKRLGRANVILYG